MTRKKTKVRVIDSTWFNTAREVRILGLSGYVVIPFVLYIFHIRWWTTFALIAVIIVMAIMDRLGMPPNIFGLYIRSKIAGKRASFRRMIGSRIINK